MSYLGYWRECALAIMYEIVIETGKKIPLVFRQHRRDEGTHFIQHGYCCLNKVSIKIPINYHGCQPYLDTGE